MPRHAGGPHLWLRKARKRAGGAGERAVWVIKDRGRQHSTRCGESDRRGAEAALGRYIAQKHAAPRRERPIDEILVADVMRIYLDDVVPGQARPDKAAERAGRLLDFWGEKALSDVTGVACRTYAKWRGNTGGARRDLQDLAAAIGHHAKEGLHRSLVKVVLPPRGKARQRWLTRDEVAWLLRTCWRHREIQEGKPTDKRPLRHLVRMLLIGIYTGSRPGAILNASWSKGRGLSWIDTVNGVFHRHAEGAAESTKRQPTVKLAPRLLGHLRRWERLDGSKGYVVTFRGQKVSSVKTALHTACKLAKVEPITAYTLRHTAASWLVAQGVATRKVADFIGTGEQMILSHYGHLAPDYQDEAAHAIGRKSVGKTVGRRN